jgi:hypothetical protein
MGMKKINKITLNEQIRLLKQYYPNGEITLDKNKGFEWVCSLKASPLGDIYKVKVTFEKEGKPKVYVVEPVKLLLAGNQLKLKHVYDHEKQQLCLYYPKNNEWHEGKMIASTIVPWTIEWLYHYELWLITEEWLGGGIHPTTSKNEK